MPPESASRSFEELAKDVGEAVAAERHDRVALLLIEASRARLDGQRQGDEEQLAWLLKDHDQFGYARRFFRRLYMDGPEDRRPLYCQQYALCVYRDLELPSSRRYRRALEILEEGARAYGWSGESLGLCGAVFKRLWQAEGRVGDLERAYERYRRGFDLSDKHRSYCGINAAYVLDALATLDHSGEDAERERRSEAREIRETLVAEFAGRALRNWDWATLAEAHFGLKNFAKAREAMAEYVRPGLTGWKRESTASQLADLARFLDIRLTEDPDAANVLHPLVGSAEPLTRRATLGKVGLALSGGGFRASLFHIGVLARLAERDALRGIEVISTVSGGAILGASYYLRVRELLNSTPDRDITPGHYADLVSRLADDFLAAVQRNPRVELTGSIKDNAKMVVRNDFSRTNRVAELLQKHLYARVENREWRMNDLLIAPQGRTGYSPRYGNWEREAKVPILVLNATTLNTGHSWQFTASQMGEPPDALDERIDANPRFRRMYYEDAPPPYHERSPRLADAVAASACVPALFPPIRLDGLYPDRTVELVDGGVHDNQGVASLIEQECTTILVSDASGQMGERPAPARSLLSVASRSNSILQSRVRGTQLADLRARERAGTLRRLMIVHLKKGLPAKPLDWGGTNGFMCPDPFTPERSELPETTAAGKGPYGIDEALQRALADVRTDLDSFSDTEAHALMAAGYRMACVELDHELGDDLPEPLNRSWPFTPMLARLADPDRRLVIEIDVAKERFGKWFRLRWRRRPTNTTGKPGGLVRTGKRAAGVAMVPVRGIVAVPVALVGAGATRVYLRTLGRVRR